MTKNKRTFIETDRAKKLLLASMGIGVAVSGATMLAPQQASADTLRYIWDVYESYTAYEQTYGVVGTETYISGYNTVFDRFVEDCSVIDQSTGTCSSFPTYKQVPIYSTRNVYGYTRTPYTAWRDTGNDITSLNPNAYTTNNTYRNKRSVVENYSPVLSEITDFTNFKNDVIDLTINATDVEDGTPSTYNAISSDESVVKVLSVEGNKVQLKAIQVGTSSITISATDTYGETTSKVFEVNVLNTKAEVDFVIVPKLVVIDDTADISFTGRASDVDGDEMTIRLTAGNGAIFKSDPTFSDFELNLRGRDILKGYYFSKSLIFEAYDGTEYSLQKTVDVPLIKVSNASDYLRVLQGHSNEYENWTDDQQSLFHKIYENVLTYEQSKSPELLDTIRTEIQQLKALTSVETSTTLTEWQNRIDVVEAMVAMEKAENSLIKVDYLTARTLAENFIASNEQEQFLDEVQNLTSRYEELEKYHTALESVNYLENNKADIKWENITETQNKINVIENSTNKAALQGRLQDLKDALMSSLEEVTVTDLLNYDVDNIELDQEIWYQEYFEAFQPLGEGNNAQELVDFSNELLNTLANFNRNNLDKLIVKVPSYAATSLNPTINALEEILSYRISFHRTVETDSTLENHITNVPFTHTLNYMEFMKNSMYETIEYNEIHDSKEKLEGSSAIIPLWEGTFKNEMQEYIDNGIPEIMFTTDNKEYINDGTLTIVGSIQDDNDTNHTVIVKFNGDEKTVTTNNRTFTVTFDKLSKNVFTSNVEIQVKDRLTKVNTILTGKPVITTNDVPLFRQYAEALEIDKDTLLQEFTPTILVKLQELIDAVKLITSDSSERSIRDTENLAVNIGGKDGRVEAITKKLIQDVRLEWLFQNYLEATVDDYLWAGITNVTTTNIDDLKQIITDYKKSFVEGTATTPTLADYDKWLELQPLIQKATTDVSTANQTHKAIELGEAIEIATKSIRNLPTWLTATQELSAELEKIKVYYNVLVLIEKVEITFDEADKLAAETAVYSISEYPQYTALIERLEIVQEFIDVADLVELAETTRLQEDINNAILGIVNLPTNDYKEQLENRIVVINQINNAIILVEQAETSLSQADTNKAKELVEVLPASEIKQELENRLSDVQAIIDIIMREKQAKEAVENAESTLIRNDALIAKEKVDGLTNGTLKDELQNRLDMLESFLDQYDEAVLAVEEAKLGKELEAIEKAQELVNQLPNGKGKELLQEQINEVKRYFEAVQSVEKAEASLIQKHKNDALVLVNALVDSQDKQNLLERLIELQKLIEQKQTTLIDDIINDLNAVTPDSLADFTGETVYVELMPDYREKLNSLGDSVTKELVVEIVQLVNKLEIAKRSMNAADIQVYQEAFANSTLSEKVELPAPTVLTSISNYLDNDDELDRVISELAISLNTDEATIRSQVEEILLGIEKAQVSNYLIRYVDSNNNVISETLIENVKNGEVLVMGEAPNGYEIIGESSKTLLLEKKQDLQVITFEVAEIIEEVTEEPAVEETITENEVTEEPETEETITENEVTEEPETEETTTENEVIEETEAEEDITENVMPVAAATIGEETTLVRSLMRMSVASLDESNVTSTQVMMVTDAPTTLANDPRQHAQYLFKAFYSLASVKAYLTNPTESYQSDLVNYISTNLYDGEFKKLLLNELDFDIAEIGDDGISDLTAIDPTVVVIPPQPTFPSTGGGSTIGEPIKDEVIKGNKLENGYEWIITNPLNNIYTLEQDGIKVTIPFEIDAEKWEISWIDIGEEQYQIIVKANGKKITSFTKPIKLEVQHNFAYLLKSQDGNYRALPYKYEDGLFSFETKSVGEFYFSTTKISFTDIENVFSKDEIQELASRHILSGTGEGKYSPYNNLTRGQFASMVKNALALETSGENPFKDVDGHWFEEQITAIYEAGITTGTTPDTFRDFFNSVCCLIILQDNKQLQCYCVFLNYITLKLNIANLLLVIMKRSLIMQKKL